MKDMFKDLFGKNSPFDGGTPSINIFYMGSPKKEAKKEDSDTTLKQILRSTRSLEAGQSPTSHGGGD